MTAREALIRHWHLRNGHSADPGYKFCQGCTHEVDDLLMALRDLGFEVVPTKTNLETKS